MHTIAWTRLATYQNYRSARFITSKRDIRPRSPKFHLLSSGGRQNAEQFFRGFTIWSGIQSSGLPVSQNRGVFTVRACPKKIRPSVASTENSREEISYAGVTHAVPLVARHSRLTNHEFRIVPGTAACSKSIPAEK